MPRTTGEPTTTGARKSYPYGSKAAEYQRTAELLTSILDRDHFNGPYFLVALLYDSGYGNDDLGRLLEYIKDEPRGLTR